MNKTIALPERFASLKDMMATTAKTRFQFDVSVERAEEVRELLLATGCETNRDLFNNALTLLEWAVEEIRKENTIASIDEKNERYRELQMPVLNAARKIARRQKEASQEGKVATNSSFAPKAST